MARYASLRVQGTMERLEALAKSGCFTNDWGEPDVHGHEYRPMDEWERYEAHADKFGWHDEQDVPLRDAYWTFSPRCRACVSAAKQYMMKERGVTQAQWEQLCEIMRISGQKKKPRKESANQARLYGTKANGQYGKLTPKDMALGAIPDDPEAAKALLEKYEPEM